MAKIPDFVNAWRVRDNFSISEVALIAIGQDPATAKKYELAEDVEPSLLSSYIALREALIDDILSEALPAIQRHKTSSIDNTIFRVSPEQLGDDVFYLRDDRGLSYMAASRPCPLTTRLKKQDACAWFTTKGFVDKLNFFNSSDGYLDPSHRCYSIKLHAAVLAWLAVSKVNVKTTGKSAKDNILNWLDKDCPLNLNGIGRGDIATVVNWARGGGTPETPDKKED